MAKKPLSEQVVVVTGASSGVGRALAREAARRGARVVVAARNGDALDAAVAEIEAHGSQAHAVAGDLAVEDECARVVEEAVDRFGRIDSFVRCQMVSVFGEVEQLTAEELRRVFDVNFFGGVWCFNAALPHLRESRGTFLDVNSGLAYRGIPLQAAYCASKAALRTFFESARVELEKAGSGVDLCLVLPGAINTPHFDRVRQKLGQQTMPVPPIYQPEAFAEAIAALLERPGREVPLGWGGQKLLWGQKLAPRFGDLFLLRTGWNSQVTGEPKPVDAPDNLWETLPGDPGARGRFSEGARASSTWTALRLARGKVALGALVGAGALVATMVARRD
jgi:NAD(P)-dependent dehydrogenase (short-subunit alcohol dehydrogenase family)